MLLLLLKVELLETPPNYVILVSQIMQFCQSRLIHQQQELYFTLHISYLINLAVMTLNLIKNFELE